MWDRGELLPTKPNTMLYCPCGDSCLNLAAARRNIVAGLKLAIDRGWLWKHESGTYVKFTQVGAEMFA